MIGDTLHDGEIAKELGCSCILFSNGHQDESLLKESGYRVINSYEELINLYD